MEEAKQLKPLTLVVILVVMLAASVLGLYRWQHRAHEATALLPENVSLERVVARIATHLVVRTEEMPTMLIVNDPDNMRMANPWFYAHAVVGDRVLLWSDQAVLYRVSLDRIIQVLPLNVPTLTSSTPATANTATSTRIITVELRNASGRPGEAKLAAKKLDSQQFQVVKLGDARKIQPTTLVVAGDSIDTAPLLSIFQATTGTIPNAEATSSAEVIVFIGEK